MTQLSKGSFLWGTTMKINVHISANFHVLVFVEVDQVSCLRMAGFFEDPLLIDLDADDIDEKIPLKAHHFNCDSFIHSFIHSFIQNIWKCVFLVTGLINPSNREIVSNCCEKDHLSSSKCCFLMSFVPKYPFVFHHQTAPLTDKMDRPSHPVQVPKSLTWSEASIMRSWLHRARDSLQARHRVEWLQDIGNVWKCVIYLFDEDDVLFLKVVSIQMEASWWCDLFENVSIPNDISP